MAVMIMLLHEELRISIEDVNDSLKQVILSDEDLPVDSTIAQHIINLVQAGGKRIRPMLVIVGSRFGVNDNDQNLVIRAATMLEYLHMASLIHDDIIDNSELRRGQATLHMTTDVPTAIHIANYMMARALEWVQVDVDVDIDSDKHKDEDLSQIATSASMITQLCIGEYQQLHNRFNFNITINQYLEKTKNKTALLMAHCLQAGALIAGADEATTQLLFEFGEALGMAFQIRDDVLDFTQSVEVIGKPAGADLMNGNVTLPVLFALENVEIAKQIRALNNESSPDQMNHIIQLIKESDALERTQLLSIQYLKTAEQIIDQLEKYQAHHDLHTLLQFFAK